MNDPQDPLPESNWFWRRVFTFVSSAILFGLLIYAAIELARIAEMEPHTGISALLDLCLRLLWLQLAFSLLYLVAPSAEQVAKMIQLAGLLKSGFDVTTSDEREDTPRQGRGRHNPDYDDIAPRSHKR